MAIIYTQSAINAFFPIYMNLAINNFKFAPLLQIFSTEQFCILCTTLFHRLEFFVPSSPNHLNQALYSYLGIPPIPILNL